MNICLDEGIARLHILFIGDRSIQNEVTKSCCHAMQEHFVWADTPKLGLALYKQYNFDVVSIDSDLESYCDIIEEIYYIRPNQRVIVMALHDSDVKLLESMRLGVTHYMQRPLNPREFYITLSQIVFDLKKMYQKVILYPHGSHINDEFSREDNSSCRLFLDATHEQIYQDESFLLPIHLSPKLKKLFWIMYYNSNNVVSYERIICCVYNNEDINYNTLRMAIVRLKKFCGELVQNVSGEGYMLSCNKAYI